jgi:uncharacterized RDD family membrane protein YckC
MRLPRAGLWRRLVALVYDALLLFGLLFTATAVLLPFTGGQAIATGNHLYSGYLLGVVFLFYGWCWTHGGQTLGMKAWRLCARDCGGRGMGWSQAALRFAFAALSWLPLGLGYLWLLVDRDRLTWHDRLSGTEVVVLPRPR